MSGPNEGVFMQEKINSLFGIPAPDAAVIHVRDTVDGPVPNIDPNYIFEPMVLKRILLWLGPKTPRKNIFLLGEAGVGKTSLPLEVCGRLRTPVWSVSCSGKTRFEHLVGAMCLVDGNTKWVDGPLTAAMRAGGVFLANEITRMDPGEQMRLVDILDQRSRLTIGETGEVIEPAADFRVAVTGNSGGHGDESGAYAGEKVGSFAFYDRFIKIKMEPLPEEHEKALLGKHAPGLPEQIRDGMVSLARQIRESFVGNGGALRITISPRSLIDWGKLACEYRLMSGLDPVKDSLKDIILNGSPEEDARVVMEIYENWVNGNQP